MKKITLFSAGLCLALSLAAAASVGDADGYTGSRNMPKGARIEVFEDDKDGYSGTQNMPAEARIEASEGDTNGYSDAQNMPGKAKVEVFECDTDGVLRCPETDIPAISEASKRRAAELVSRMTLEEKLSYIGGVDGFYIREIPRLGIPRIRMADGPQGVRNDTKSTMYPCGMAAAATWNRELAYAYGKSLGRDARARGVHIMLGPGVNIYRFPKCGRNFEYYGEDPYLTSETAVAYIKGMQSVGVISTIKHFCGNNQEYSRHHVSSDIDERTLNEIYLPSFRKAVQEARTGAVMSSYNLVNSVHMTENKSLIKDLLRDKWGFEGIFMSDWTAAYSNLAPANNGLDLEMSWGQFMNPRVLKEAIETGTVTEKTIDEKCQHILQTLIEFGFLDRDQLDTSIPEQNPESDMTALKVAREAVVLLENEDDFLPFSKKIRKVAVLGPNSGNIPTGGGSGFVEPFTTVSVTDGIAAFYKLVPDASKADAVVYCAGFNSHIEGEDHDRPFELPSEQIAQIDSIAALNPNLVVVVNAGGGVDFKPLLARAKAVLMAWYPGQQGGRAVAEIISGRVNPSGRLPISVESRLEDNPVFNNYYCNTEKIYNSPYDRVTYFEGVFVGYRGYDRSGVEPLFPFGYGLSYTDFSFSDIEAEKLSDGRVHVSATVKNIGKCAGAEVVQLYVNDETASVPRPEKELKGYEKVYLEPGESRSVEFILDSEAFAYYDMDRHEFMVEPGIFNILIGASSRDIRLTTAVTL